MIWVKNNLLKNILLVILLWLGIIILNNTLNIKHILFDGEFKLDFLTFEIIFSMIISLFYVFVVRGRNKYLDIAFYLMLGAFNLFAGILSTTYVNTFFLLYIFLITFSFTMYKKIENFSFSLITTFCIMLLCTLILGVFNLLFVVKYLIPICFVISLFYIYFNKNEYNILATNFFNKEFIIFTLLVIVAIIGGLGRCVHVYDEYSHWAYDAKVTINYDKFGSNPDVMTKTRGYAPVITSWHYIVAQYAGFNESNLYIGLSIFCSIFIMAIFCNVYKKNNFLLLLSGVVAYSAVFYFGGVYSYSTLYADLAFACTFTALLICYFYYRDKKEKNISLLILLPVVTLIKPSGCIVVFAFAILMFVDYLFQNNIKISSIFGGIIRFIKKYFKVILIIVFAYLFWNIYIIVINHLGKEFYDYSVMPWTLTSDMSYKLNTDFILTFFNATFKSFDGTYLYSLVNISYFKFLILLFVGLYFAIYFSNGKDLSITNKKIASLGISYIVFFIATMFSIFFMLSYYEASVLASVERYVDVMNVALVYLFIFFVISKTFVKNKKYEIAACLIMIIMIFGLNFSQVTAFCTDIKTRIETKENRDSHVNKFEKVLENTTVNDNIYIIDQKDTDGIMAMWYARYYLFPRNVNASSGAISWKIKTDKNTDDLQNWGMTATDLKKCLIKYNFDYLYLYSVDDDFFDVTNDFYADKEKAKKYTLFKVKKHGKNVILTPVA